MNHTDFHWMNGSVTYWDLTDIDETRPLSEQLDCLKEDLAQLQYPNGIALDIGWYPSFDRDGEFVLLLIRNEAWETPVFRGTAKDLPMLKEQISMAVGKITQTLVLDGGLKRDDG